MKKKLIATLLVICLVVLWLPFAAVSDAIIAEESGDPTVIVHFYNGDGQYAYDEWEGVYDVKWGAYYWIDTGRTVFEVGDDEDFHKKDDSSNVGKIFHIKLNASEAKAVTQGKKLGLIMVRSYVDELGYNTPYWCNNKGKDLNADRYLSVQFNAKNQYEVWIIAGDKNNYLSLEAATGAFERVESANFDDFNRINIQTTTKIDSSTRVNIYKITDAANATTYAAQSGEPIYKDIIPASTGEHTGVVTLPNDFAFEWGADYLLEVNGIVTRTAVNKTRLFLSDRFRSECIPTGSDYDNVKFGANYDRTDSSTTFYLWAPISTNVQINFYRTGNELDTRKFMAYRNMTKYPSAESWKGVWTLTVSDKDLNGVYYTYNNFVYDEQIETVDIYATALGVNGNRAMVCDLDATDPEGWEEDFANAERIRQYNSADAVIWEIHVRDFSISPDSGLTYKGKYLAFTEEGTTVKGTDYKSGIDYLKELGVTYVHLNPVFDFSTVDEEYINNTDYTMKQNWGYDPKNYNVPEGSYATDAENGEVRINEFKQMVQALHNAGIGVIMDVVYNHTYTADSYFEKTVPGYYYRQELSGQAGTFGYQSWTTNNLGNYNLSDGSGCSNETASEREMFRRYMVDSLSYWVEEYHIDGFRFDLMMIHDVKTMNTIRGTLNGLTEQGAGILLYGEPWAAASLGLDPAYENQSEYHDIVPAGKDNFEKFNSGIYAFNDVMRNAIKGEGDGGKGYVQGVTGNAGKIESGLNGYFYGVSTDKNGDKSIMYTTSHDNYTLWDQLIASTVTDKTPTLYSASNFVLEKKNMMAATLTLSSKGITFILAGEEIARTKYGNHNSYNAQDKINEIEYGRQEEFSALYDWYKGMIALRVKGFPSIGKTSPSGIEDKNGCLIYYFIGENDSQVKIMMNPTSSAVEIDIGDDDWTLIANSDGLSNGKVFDFDSADKVSGNLNLKPYTTYIVRK